MGRLFDQWGRVEIAGCVGVTQTDVSLGPILDLTPKPTAVTDLVREAWASRELAITLARREFYSRYRRASLGLAWAVLMPLVQAAVLAIVFTKVARIGLPGNAFVFVFSGMASWAFFNAGVTSGATAIVDNAALASRIYFPRMTLPLVAAGSVAYILFVNYVLVLIVAYATGTSFGVRILYAPLSLVLAVLVTALMAAVLSAIHVYFRDTKYIVQAVLIVAFYLTPVFYPLTRAPKALRIVDEINPMTGVIELLRRATSGADPSWATAVGVSCVWIVGLFVLALSLYRRRERTFSDLM